MKNVDVLYKFCLGSYHKRFRPVHKVRSSLLFEDLCLSLFILLF